MTLLRQLIIVIVVLFLLLFAGSVAINVQNTRYYLNNQLKSISEDMATSLGLSLSPHMAAKEMAVVESMVTALSDSGYYREIVVNDVHGKTVVERSQPLTIEGVPAWFIKLIPLNTPVGEAMLMDGWQQAGNVHISANPGYAYKTLWDNTVEAFWWFLGASAFVLMLGIVALHYVLRPLRQVEAQAKAICDREYPVQNRLPWTLELKSVVEAMNRMTSKVKEMFDEQAVALERVRSEAYKDALTGLANRKYFDMQIRHLIGSAEEFQTGALIFVELHDFKKFNEMQGYQAGDRLLKESARLIEQTCEQLPDVDKFIARFPGANFAVVISDIQDAEALAIAQRIVDALKGLHEQGVTKLSNVAHAGVAIYHGQALGELLSETDLALRAAQVKGANCAHLSDSKAGGGYVTYAAGQWKEILTGVLEKKAPVLYRQAAKDPQDGRSIHEEVLLRIYGEDGALIPAGVLLPMIKRLHLGLDFDKYVVVDAVARIAQAGQMESPIAINLAPSSILDAGFVAWLVTYLRPRPEVARQLCFEVMEHAVRDDLDALRGWIDQMKTVGISVGLDQFGKGFSKYDYLTSLKVDYIKLDGSFIRGIEGNNENKFFVDSLLKIAHGLDIKVIAESVETEAEQALLRELKVDGVKGFGVEQPRLWERG